MSRASRPTTAGWYSRIRAGQVPNISLDRVAEGCLPPLGEISRVHMDLYTADEPAEVERLLGLGATRYEREYRQGEDFVVLVDPDGNRFCVIDKPDERPPPAPFTE